MAVNGTSSATARSIVRSAPPESSAAASAPRGCPGTRSVLASRLAVPCGTIASGTPVLARPSAQPRTVPSPPTATTRSIPSSAAELAADTPASAFSVTRNSGRHPWRAAASRHNVSKRPLPRTSEPLTTNATPGIRQRGYPQGPGETSRSLPQEPAVRCDHLVYRGRPPRAHRVRLDRRGRGQQRLGDLPDPLPALGPGGQRLGGEHRGAGAA